jgi:HSP20 family protein
MPAFRPGFPLPFEEFRDELDRFWTTLTSAPPATERSATGGFPPVNVNESDEAIIVEAELPGVDASAVEISVHGDELTIAGTRPEDARDKSASADGESTAEPKLVTWHRRERQRGSFSRRLTLPVTVDASRIEARLVNGVLTVTCPKTAASQPRKVEVRAG